MEFDCDDECRGKAIYMNLTTAVFTTATLLETTNEKWNSMNQKCDLK